jgi:hypothetical protein
MNIKKILCKHFADRQYFITRESGNVIEVSKMYASCCSERDVTTKSTVTLSSILSSTLIYVTLCASMLFVLSCVYTSIFNRQSELSECGDMFIACGLLFTFIYVIYKIDKYTDSIILFECDK